MSPLLMSFWSTVILKVISTSSQKGLIALHIKNISFFSNLNEDIERLGWNREFLMLLTLNVDISTTQGRGVEATP